jgi:hypothetical protein
MLFHYSPPKVTWQEGILLISLALNLREESFLDWPIQYWDWLAKNAKTELENRSKRLF